LYVSWGCRKKMGQKQHDRSFWQVVEVSKGRTVDWRTGILHCLECPWSSNCRYHLVWLIQFCMCFPCMNTCGILLLRKPSRMSFHDQPWMMVFALTALHDHDFPNVSGFTQGPPGRPHRSGLTDHRLLSCSSRRGSSSIETAFQGIGCVGVLCSWHGFLYLWGPCMEFF
jgi:hypothetical protein